MSSINTTSSSCTPQFLIILQSLLPHAVKRLLEVYKIIIQCSIHFSIFLRELSDYKYLLHCSSSFSESRLFFTHLFIHLFSTVLRSFFLVCCVLNRSFIASSFSPSIQNLLFLISVSVFFILILIPAITSLWSDSFIHSFILETY